MTEQKFMLYFEFLLRVPFLKQVNPHFNTLSKVNNDD